MQNVSSRLIDEKPEADEGYVTLVNAEEVNGEIRETEKRTGVWAWKHYHKDTGETSYRKLEGKVEFNDVDFGYSDEKIVLHNIEMYRRTWTEDCFRWFYRSR